jgi:hypothetical protein
MRTGGGQNGLTGKAVSERFFFRIFSVFQQCNNIFNGLDCGFGRVGFNFSGCDYG